MSDPINALVRFFVEAGQRRHDTALAPLNIETEELAEALGVELGADADTIEMAIRSKLTVPPPVVRRFYEDKAKG